MKAVITEIRGAKAAALYDDGSIRLLDNSNYQIGQVIHVKTAPWYNKATRWVAAAAAVLLISSGAASYAYLNPVATVNLDVNPSIEFRVNQFDKVLSAKALNDDGAEILKDLDLKGMEIDKAIETAIDAMVDQEFITNEENAVSVTILHKNEEKQKALTVHLGEEINAYMEQNGIEAEVEVEGIGAERVALAAQVNEDLGDDYTMTPGKLNLLQKLSAAQGIDAEDMDEAAEVEAYLNDLKADLDKDSLNDLTVKDIMKEIKRARLGGETLPEEQAKDKDKDKGETSADGSNSNNPDKVTGKPDSAPGQEGKDNVDQEDKTPNENANENAEGNNAGGNKGGK